MTPKEIAQHPILRELVQRKDAWTFLRACTLYNNTFSCRECHKDSCPVVATPYRVDLCLLCLVKEIREGSPYPGGRLRDPRSADYDEEYAIVCQAWEHQSEGIEWA